MSFRLWESTRAVSSFCDCCTSGRSKTS